MVVPPQRDGGQRQFVEQPVPRCSSDGLAPVLDWVLEHLEVEHTVTDLARRAPHVRPQLRPPLRRRDRHHARTAGSPLQRVQRAQRLLEDTDLGIDEVAESSGFGSGALLRHHFRKVVGVAPADYRRTFTVRAAVVGS